MSNKTNDNILDKVLEEYQELGGSNAFLRFLVMLPQHRKIEALCELNEMLRGDGFEIEILKNRTVTCRKEQEYPPEFQDDMEELHIDMLIDSLKSIRKDLLNNKK